MRLWLGWSGVVDEGTYAFDDLEHSRTPDVFSLRTRSADLPPRLQSQARK